MAIELEKAYDSKKTEDKIYKLWEESGFFDPDNLAQDAKEPFVIMMAPPNVTGSLHMGHALENTISDILIRWKRMKGFRTLWLPGTDHAGIATQNVVEKELRKQGQSRHQLGREKFLEKVWEWKEIYGNIILEQLKKLGVSADWSRTRFTMDDDYRRAVEAAFVHYYGKGRIYRGERVINWCPRCRTSLSDLEVEYKEEAGKLWYIKYSLVENSRFQISDSKFIVVATTRPESMLGDAAVAVNPKDKRYKNLIGQKVNLPLVNREIPIIADSAVDMKFGTGAIKVTPAHDLLDAEIAFRHNLPNYQIVGEDGKMTEKAGEICRGLTTKECRGKVVSLLEELELIERIEDYVHNVSVCSRCGNVIEPLLSKQWFLKMDELAQYAIDAVKNKKVKIIPKNFEKPYFDWLNNIKDWCISRQIWWGHQLPVWQCKCQTGRISNLAHQKPEDIFVVSSVKPKQQCSKCKSHYERVFDVLDTWFSSALWPFATLGWPFGVAQGKPGDLERFYPANIITSARDILNLWDARMIFSGMEFMGKSPFSHLIIHATILTKEGKRMSKSLGTGIDPLDLIERYGADALRFGLIWQMMGHQDIRWDETAVVAGKKFANKLWNASRFVLGRIPEDAKLKIPPLASMTLAKRETDEAGKKILREALKTRKQVEKHMEKYQFGHALREIYDFFWHKYCDVYLEESKKLDDNHIVLVGVLAESLKMLHPFMPFITEEIYQKMPLQEKTLLMIER